MTNKIVKNYVYHGLGFPVTLPKVELINIHDEWHPKINVRKIADEAILELINQHERLTGNQIKFVRTYFEMSLRAFAEAMNESHMAVKKWEDFKNQPTRMDKNIEIMLRLYIYEKRVLGIKNTIKQKADFYQHFLKIRNNLSHHSGVK
jgi:DNA-binding transcriptional regulator YiaG